MYETHQIDNIHRAIVLNDTTDLSILAVKDLLHEITDNEMEGTSHRSDAGIGLTIRGNCVDIEELDFDRGYSVSLGRLRVFTDTDDEEIVRYLEMAKLIAPRSEHEYIDHLISLMN